MFLFKTLQLFILPSVFAPTLIFLGILLLFFKKRKRGRVLIICGFLSYLVFSSTPTANFLVEGLEGRHRPLEEEGLGEAEKAVMLLGGKEADILRAVEVLRIAEKNKDVKIFIAGRDPLNAEDRSGQKVKRFLEERGMDGENIRAGGESRTTFENAKSAKQFVGEEPFFLVTSAYHMPRSLLTFKKLDMEPIPAPCDFKKEKRSNFLDFLPDPANLLNSDRALHEYFGMWYYRFKYFK